MEETRTNLLSPRTALLVDAIACLAGAILLILVEPVWDWIALPESWRIPVAIALLVFALLLFAAARNPARRMYALAVLGNMAWIIGGAIALFVTTSLLGGILIAGVMLADAIMAWFQAQALVNRNVVSHNNASYGS